MLGDALMYGLLIQNCIILMKWPYAEGHLGYCPIGRKSKGDFNGARNREVTEGWEVTELNLLRQSPYVSLISITIS